MQRAPMWLEKARFRGKDTVRRFRRTCQVLESKFRIRMAQNKRPPLERPSGGSSPNDYLGGGVVVAGLVPAGAAGLLLVPAGLVVTGLAGAGTPDWAL